MEFPSVEVLLQALQEADEDDRTVATDALWQLWFNQKGEEGQRRLSQSQLLLSEGRVEAATDALTALIAEFPDFAEAWNRRAVLYYSQQQFPEAIADCQRVIDLVPYHFGALHGLGLCYAALEQYAEAIQAFRQALAVQPYATVNQRLILECTARLN